MKTIQQIEMTKALQVLQSLSIFFIEDDLPNTTGCASGLDRHIGNGLMW
jgi:hypothetical protein